MSPEGEIHRFTRVEFKRFKALKNFKVDLKHFNVLVGPNNAGKSTILAAFRILAAAMRRASTRKAVPVGDGLGFGHIVDLSTISVAEENIYYNYDDSEGALITFHLSSGSKLHLQFPSEGVCYLFAEGSGRTPTNPSSFRKQFNCRIGFVPILGPVEHHEPLYGKEAARLALYNYRAARNFRNIWYHYPEKFEEFRTTLKETWPGMDIDPPEFDPSHEQTLLHMFCPEERFPRELFWAGFGFQVWCQMLTHLIQSSDVSLFLIDEPDIYLHSELQRQLLGLLRNLGPDVLIATHSTEIITEAETDEIVLINKRLTSSRRLRNPSQLGEVFLALGSNTNPVLTQLAKTRRALFVEGKDFQILGKFARKLGESNVSNRRDFAVVPVEGFNPERIRNLKAGMETTLGDKVVASAILDKDYRSNKECNSISTSCAKFVEFVRILKCKEVENFLLVPLAIDRAIRRKIADQSKRTGKSIEFQSDSAEIIENFATENKHYIVSQLLSRHRDFERANSPRLDSAKVDEEELSKIDQLWNDPKERLRLIGGKEALTEINKHTQSKYGVGITATAIIDAMHVGEIPEEMKDLVSMMITFSSTRIDT